jgi:hypothetical protein
VLGCFVVRHHMLTRYYLETKRMNVHPHTDPSYVPSNRYDLEIVV